MYKKVWYTCKVVVLLIKPIVFLPFSLPSPSSLLKLPDLLTNAYINSGSKGGTMVRAVVRALTSHQCGPGLNPGVDSIVCSLVKSLVLYLARRSFFSGSPVFILQQSSFHWVVSDGFVSRVRRKKKCSDYSDSSSPAYVSGIRKGKGTGILGRVGGWGTPARARLLSPSRLLIMYAKMTQL